MKSSISITELLTPLDWSVFFLIILVTFLAVVVGNRMRPKGPESAEDSMLDLLIMGRQLTLPLFVGTLVATWYGGIFGVTQIAFEKGIYNFITQGLFWYITYIIFALFLVTRIKRYQAVTLPDLVGKMYGPRSAKLSALFNFFNILPIAYVISLAILIKSLFGLDLVTGSILGVLVVTAYSFFGGFRAVVFSDLIQFFVMCLGVFLVLLFSASEFGGIAFLKQALPPKYFSPTGGTPLLTMFVWGFIALSTLVDPNFYQRCFAARDEKVAKRGILISTLVWIGFDICTTAGAMYARAILPEANSADAYLTYALQILPDGLRGFFLAGIAATILSTLDSYIFIAGTTVGYDLAPKRLKGKIWLHHLGVILVGILSVILASGFQGNIKLVWKTLGSYSAACLLFPILIGYIAPKKITDNQFVISCLVGVIAVTYWRNTEHSGFWSNVDELYVGIIGTSLSLAIAYFFGSEGQDLETKNQLA